MGTYYDIVCPKHKEVLRLWKAYDLAEKLEYWMSKGKLKKEIVLNSKTEEIVLQSSAFKAVNRERPKAKDWLKTHKNCKLFFIDSEHDGLFGYYEDFTQIDGQ
jgi:hypothetical protein